MTRVGEEVAALDVLDGAEQEGERDPEQQVEGEAAVDGLDGDPLVLAQLADDAGDDRGRGQQDQDSVSTRGRGRVRSSSKPKSATPTTIASAAEGGDRRDLDDVLVEAGGAQRQDDHAGSAGRSR